MMIYRFRYLVLIVFLISLGYTPLINGQSNIKITSGIGIPEFLHMGIQMERPGSHLGFSIGFMPGVSESLRSTSLDYFIHFRKRKEGTKNPWYFRTGAAYTREHTRTKIFTNVLINMRFGRMIRLEERVRMYIDLGIAINAYEDEVRKVPVRPNEWNWNLDIDVPFIPSGCLVFYVRL